VNVSSSVTLKWLPMLAVYTASKAALNAFTESRAVELEPFNVRGSLVLPGQAPETPFGQNAQAQMHKQGVAVPDAYSDFARSVFERVTGGLARELGGRFTRPLDVAEVIWGVANDPARPIRQPAGADAVELARSN
jgi:NAD(P)-dependent dehydrogenase (short-subunit alcohol dehydrogenase family)